MPRSVEIREQAKVKHALVGEILRLAGDDRDFSKKDVLEKLGATDSADAVKKWQALNAEAHSLFAQAAEAEVEEDIQAYQTRDEELKRPKPTATARHPAGKLEAKTFGRMFVESEPYQLWRKAGLRSAPIAVEVPIELKTLVSTSAGFAPDSPRTSDVVPFATRPVQILDLIPTDPVNVSVVKWMEKTTYTISAAEVAEGAASPESTYVWTERSENVRKITDSIPVTDEQLEDVDQMSALLDADLRFGLRQKLDSQVINGNGVSPNLRGILNVSGIQTQARGTDPHFDAIFKALTKVRATGRAEPDAILVHSTDWQTIRLTRTADGIYIMGNPAEPGPLNLFGVPVVINEVLTAGTALVGDFSRYARLKEKRGIEVMVGFSGTQFVEGKKTLRADMRVAFIVRRAAAFCQVTGL
ncbi:MAG TPA: phage major capsid protein [Gemmatimonadales bacterium]|nr:phage major capsid protein [Gemmatimonadales bacterium]